MHKKQHFIPESYLKAWCDPNTPATRTPYVWQFSIDGNAVRKKAPRNIFHETDMYTIEDPNGERNLFLEHGLSQLESKFCTIRDSKIAAENPITIEERILMCAFMAAMTARTRAFRDHHKEFWTGLLPVMEEKMEQARSLSMEEKLKIAKMNAARKPNEKSFTYNDVKELATRPMQKMFPSTFKILAPKLCALDMAILKAPATSPGFITSDNPCVWFDPKWHTRPPMFQSPALGYASIKIWLPISPGQIILLNRASITGYFPIPERHVDDINRITRFHADKHFVVNSNVIRLFSFSSG